MKNEKIINAKEFTKGWMTNKPSGALFACSGVLDHQLKLGEIAESQIYDQLCYNSV